MNRFISFAVMSAAVLSHAYVTYDGRTVPDLPLPSDTVNVSTNLQFHMALIALTPGQTILLADGAYDMANYEPLTLNDSNVCIRGASNDPTKVIITGHGFSNNYNVDEELFVLNTSHVTFAYITISESRCHGVKFQSGNNDRTIFHCVRFINIGERKIKGPSSTNALACTVRYCHFEDLELPATDRCVGTPCEGFDEGGNYIAGMDIRNGDSWVMENNCFVNIRGATGQGRGGIFLWNSTVNMIAQANTFINCDKSICFGNPSGVSTSVDGGYIRNNMIYPGIAMGIEMYDCNNIKVFNNTTFSSLNTSSGALFYTRSQNCQIKNNIFYGGLNLTGNSPDTAKNITVTRSNKAVIGRWFQGDVSAGNLHLVSDTSSAINNGVNLSDVTLDWDGLARDSQNDIGADEYSNNPVAVDVSAAIKGETYLSNAHPNPFNPSTVIRYGISKRESFCPFSITVLSADGKEVRTLVEGIMIGGNYAVKWDGADNTGNQVASGRYIIRLQAGNNIKTVIATTLR
ncbi:MAG: hypothetical protein A2268_04125 [Candidatus Raymondbacteria bacterium RifOxyA12_full_50_37]|uniref:FlgD/Vpr Ig-like domain-containing protein n=1 Tax=Candidatus Raymondbacteria bacterium RIFOXYD12_FULL_49_13 TaxID=1817890 RepID=A0A1F7FB85_UNCRA|nr:MAG: hypothetical protein A2268_04125 [Candidatus Raymondbacteria bacterium RifOxyA12_full_50_37]OGJ92589.1 MAG: hypothetical protein A2248_05825 [Candidatus Raymondbacteria bacterium RIFOXYA2_FULL_49_16]OGJ92714.1 MAG: hypothetical protein A2350_16745 [Candidatus Raymondbacteria bacterium RifOxyB12_full_50_8]OGJ97943.1 MAG: hypothetical protein A2453_02850 [Candidatus Raymondbacteria bacterium RIFOXYC2_FULL_50_21]OGK02040.1 MAG: hypothetical protein A2487_01255 [Candidatus Raymondbacteria b